MQPSGQAIEFKNPGKIISDEIYKEIDPSLEVAIGYSNDDHQSS